MTVEAALAKLQYLLKMYNEIDQIKAQFGEDLFGEQTETVPIGACR